MCWRLGDDVNSPERKALGILAFLRNHHRSASFQTGDLPVDMQHLRFEKRCAITSDNRARLGCCTQPGKLDAQRSASNRSNDCELPSLRKEEGEGEGLCIQIAPAPGRTPHLNALPWRRGEAKEARSLQFKLKTVGALPPARGSAGRFVH